MTEITLKNAVVLSMAPGQEEPFPADIFIGNGRIKAIGTNLPSSGKVIDADGLVVMPGFVQSHIHLCQTLFRNMAEDMELLNWLHQKIWPLEAAHSERSLRASARLGLAELISGGTTAILDMGSVRMTDVLFEEAAKAGIRANIGKTLMDKGDRIPKALSENGRKSVEDGLRLLKRWRGAANGRLDFNFAPRFALSCSENVFRDVAGISVENEIIVHTHASENQDELRKVRGATGMRNLEYYHAAGLDRFHLSVAHCIWLDDGEMDILAHTNTHVLHCPSSNLKLGSGIAKVPEMLRLGIKVSLGADGAPCNNNLDMFQEMRLAGLIQKPRAGVKSLPAGEIVRMATVGGARALGLAHEIGTLEIGKKADLILINLNRVHTFPMQDIYTQLVYAARATDVQTVIIDGEIVMENRELISLNHEEILARAQEELKNILRA
ncbi:melamine deaminase [bacterium BMS3Abin05]|nr:melamine deaminase [bacterium BMS3Abin05]GBE28458.1 melamine deaminase [bacterium BMS3Bbin03]HDZ11909.1 5'-deoxyadenosine deaminase [Bacteroidota bacterium]